MSPGLILPPRMARVASSSESKTRAVAFVHQHLGVHRRLLHHPAVGGQVALEDGDAALGVVGVGQGPDDLRVEDLHRRQVVGHGPAGDGQGRAVDEAGVQQGLHDRRHAAGPVQVLQVVGAAGAQGAEVRGAVT